MYPSPELDAAAIDEREDIDIVLGIAIGQCQVIIAVLGCSHLNVIADVGDLSPIPIKAFVNIPPMLPNDQSNAKFGDSPEDVDRARIISGGSIQMAASQSLGGGLTKEPNRNGAGVLLDR